MAECRLPEMPTCDGKMVRSGTSVNQIKAFSKQRANPEVLFLTRSSDSLLSAAPASIAQQRAAESALKPFSVKRYRDNIPVGH